MTSTRLNYSVGAEAWYTPTLDRDRSPSDGQIADELRIGRDAYTADGADDGCCWEFYIRQVRYPDGRPLALRIEMFDDAWAALAEVPDLFARLAGMSTHMGGDHDGRSWTLADVVAVLDELGFTDATQRVAR